MTREPGLAFVGLRLQRVATSDLRYGVGEEARPRRQSVGADVVR